MTDDEALALSERCPDNKGGGSHHITTKMGHGGMVTTCLTCKKTPEQIIEEVLNRDV